MIDQTHTQEITMIEYLNVFYDWDLKHSGVGMEHYDAIGMTPGNIRKHCLIEMKFRKHHYDTMMLEKKKYDWLMRMPKSTLKFYLVHDPLGTYIFWLDNLKLNDIVIMKCPSKTFWDDQGMTNKEVYLLEINQAFIKIIKK
tara:strand:+ start:6535 stop:6957 length:423 start_codon:yes stop_codon:yes gene_type:complete